MILVDDEVTLRRRRRPDRDRHVGHLDMQGVAVGLGIDRDRLDAHAAGGFDDPAGDLAAVGNQDSLEHSGYETRVPVVWLNGVLAAVSMTAASPVGRCRRGDRKPPLTSLFMR